MTTDPFEGIESELDERTVSGRTVALRIPDRPGLPREERDLRYVVYAGVFTMLAERLRDTVSDEGEARDRLGRVASRAATLLPTLRFWLHEKSTKAEQEELVARMRGRGVAVTRDWMIPKLEGEITVYEARVATLREAIAGHGHDQEAGR
ncbi:MAG TPA: hypothetical protein VEM93_06885 [Actinomycetota bacterium]|nr:hypothetical protein [Actinomycetota bacterium]